MPRNVALSDDTREEIREMKEKNPRLTQRELAQHFGVSDVTIHNVLTYWAKPHAPTVKMMLAPSCSVKQSESILSPITREMLMAGNARRVRSAA